MSKNSHFEWLKEGVKSWNTRRKKVEFTPDLSGADLSSILPPDFRDTKFAPKASRHFEKIDLSGSDLRGANLSDLNFSGANFSNSNLASSDMSASNFSGANFLGTNLEDINAQRAIFDGAKFENAKLEAADFREAIAIGAVFVESPLSLEQVEVLGGSGLVKIFASRAEWQDWVEVSKARAGSDYVQDGAILRGEDKRTRKNRFDVFFGTNRDPVYEQGILAGFGNLRQSEIFYGVCEVIVPEGHQVGSLGTRSWKRLFNKADDQLRMEKPISLDQELFWKYMLSVASKMTVKQKPTLFIHGYNNSFEYAVLRAAQIGYDLGLGQGIGLFSWPSKGKVLGYLADKAAADSSKYLLADFIEEFITNSESGGINVIAHSMGCHCLLGALEVLSNNRKSVLRQLDQVIMAAADVDTSIMPQLGMNAVKYSKRTTSYVSDKDIPLAISGWAHKFPRVGITPPTYVLEGMDTVLVNNKDLGFLSHGYVGSSRSVLTDIHALLKGNEHPSKRSMVEVAGPDFWRIKN